MEKINRIAMLGKPLFQKAVTGDFGDMLFLDTNPVLAARATYDAVFVFSDAACRVDPETVAGWIGHPHLRVICGDTSQEQTAVLRRELQVMFGTKECERKFLIGYPDLAAMEASPFCAASHIVQTYLASEEGVTERVRMREDNGAVAYTHTLKKRIERQVNVEVETRIDGGTYSLLLQRADDGRKPIEKTRWCILHRGKYFELDVYPFWDDRAVVELETAEQSDEEIDFPPYFRVIREVTGDRRYTNAGLAAEVPYDELG